MDEERFSHLLQAIRSRVDRRFPEDEAVERHGASTIADAVSLGLIDVDDGTFWQVDRGLFLTRAGKEWLKRRSTVRFDRPPTRSAAWLRGALDGLRPRRS